MSCRLFAIYSFLALHTKWILILILFNDLPYNVFLFELGSANWAKQFLASILLDVPFHAVSFEYVRGEAGERCYLVTLLEVCQTNDALRSLNELTCEQLGQSFT